MEPLCDGVAVCKGVAELRVTGKTKSAILE